jgi:hypothetical protein
MSMSYTRLSAIRPLCLRVSEMRLTRRDLYATSMLMFLLL